MPSPEEIAQRKTEKMDKELSLDDKQFKKIYNSYGRKFLIYIYRSHGISATDAVISCVKKSIKVNKGSSPF